MLKTIKNLIVIAILFSMTSCATILSANKKIYAIVDPPSDLKVKNLSTGENLDVIDCVVLSESNNAYPGKFNSSTTFYNYQGKGVKMKVKKNTQLEFTSNGVSKTIEVTGKGNIKTFWAIWADIVLTAGVGLIVDLSTGKLKYPYPEYIDVSSLFSNKPQRTKKELKAHIRTTLKRESQ